jgi:hypothetical protein
MLRYTTQLLQASVRVIKACRKPDKLLLLLDTVSSSALADTCLILSPVPLLPAVGLIARVHSGLMAAELSRHKDH